MPELSILLKPVSGLCNMRCAYCFYADEAAHRATPDYGRMSLATAEAVIRRALAFAEGRCTFFYQGGEPTLAGLDFYRAVLALQKKWNVHGVVIENAIQTNGLLPATDPAWTEFFAQNHFLVGLSLDGPQPYHDALRPDAAGAGTHDRAMQTLRALRASGVPFNVLCVVTAQNAGDARSLYRFFAGAGAAWQQYIPCTPPLQGASAPYALTNEAYAQFLKDLFDCWYKEAERGQPRNIRYFIGLLNLLGGYAPGACEMNGVCGRQFVVEADGSVFPCDFYALDRYRLGNLCTDSFAALEQKRTALGFIRASRRVPEDCKACRWAPLCRNGCRRDRLVVPDGTPDGLLDKTRYCSAYQTFFAYAEPRLEKLAHKYFPR